MEEKKQLKVSLGAVVSVFIIMILIIALGAVYYLAIVKNNEKIAELEKNHKETITQLENRYKETIEKLENNIEELLKDDEVDLNNKEQKEDNENINDSKTKEFVSSEPKISFQYPNDWIIVTNNWNIWNKTIKAPQDGIIIIIEKKENENNEELKDLIYLDWGSNILDEGVLNIENYKAYYKKYTFGDAQYSIQAKEVMIDAGNGDYYSISLVIGGENVNFSLEEAYEKYESVLSNLLSSLQF